MTCSDVSTVNYRDMGHGIGQRDFLKFSLNYLTQNIKEKFRKPSGFRNFYGCGGRTRTYDLRVMSPTSFQLLYSAILLAHFLSAWIV